MSFPRIFRPSKGTPFKPYVVGPEDYDEDIARRVIPDETKCAICECMIGEWLGYDPETTADTFEFTHFAVLDPGMHRLVCEDCFEEHVRPDLQT